MSIPAEAPLPDLADELAAATQWQGQPLRSGSVTRLLLRLTCQEPTSQALRVACAGRDPDMFFPATAADVTTAKAVCDHCLARLSCLEGAQQRREPWGVWGGELFADGIVISHKRGRGRPRKNETTQPAGGSP
jgi:WhiB family transcriptional regulator, redox-sensing transcriptional regulator